MWMPTMAHAAESGADKLAKAPPGGGGQRLGALVCAESRFFAMFGLSSRHPARWSGCSAMARRLIAMWSIWR